MQLKDSLSGENRHVLPSHVSIYACGITPYSSAHVGHARTYVVFDLLAKTLRGLGHRVSLARNITDIDDKIIAAAVREGVHWSEISERYSAENRALMLATGVEVPLEPKASEHLPAIFELIGKLQVLGLAYLAESGDVLYRVSAFQPEGGLLARHGEGALRSQQGQSRVATEGKEDARDFALWKRVAAHEPGFESPWGWGRPGWHVECSAMIGALYGGSVTIHGGGVDLKFPHHQAEIMQSEPVYRRPLADIWMHNGSVLSDGQKMSKSLGNYVTWAEALEQADRLAPGQGGSLLRLSLLQAHWQKPLDWSESLLQATATELKSLTRGLTSVSVAGAERERLVAAFLGQLKANLNMPAAMVWLRARARAGDAKQLAVALDFLGIDVQAWANLQEQAAPVDSDLFAQLTAQREEARRNKDWARADALREQLLALGVIPSDQKA